VLNYLYLLWNDSSSLSRYLSPCFTLSLSLIVFIDADSLSYFVYYKEISMFM